MSTRANIYLGKYSFTIFSDGYPSNVRSYLEQLIKEAQGNQREVLHSLLEVACDPECGFIGNGSIDYPSYEYHLNVIDGKLEVIIHDRRY